ncbi:MAG: DUF2793 domain-containing protein [Pseudomonadota bacterium]
MSDRSPKLDLPYILPNQAQKHVTHNEAIRRLDALAQITVLSRQFSTAPTSPVEGDTYIVATVGEAEWVDHDDQLAAWQDGAWEFYDPQTGWLTWVADEEVLCVYDGASWNSVQSESSTNDGGDVLGVNTTATLPDRLSVKSDAVLLSHDDVTPGSGDMRAKLNKSGVENTTSLLFQSEFSGRAEIGLTGDDNLHFKVSNDGSVFKEALIVEAATGSVSFPNTSFSGNELPSGGTAGQVLTKTGAQDENVTWANPLSSRPLYPTHTSGILAEWYFDEGTGPRARDVRNGYDIVFDETFQNSYNSSPEWTRRGLLLRGDMIQSPAIAGMRTLAIAYRSKRDDVAGFIASVGPGGGNGVLPDSASQSFTIHSGGGQGIRPLYRRATGQAANLLTRGGWQILFIDFNQDFSNKIGFGGRHSTTTSRFSEFEIAWAACWDDALTASERHTVYEGARLLLAQRGLFVDWRDCSETADCVLLWGQSNADGRAQISDLSTSNQARTRADNVWISPGGRFGGAQTAARIDVLKLGENQKVFQNSPAASVASAFGPELGAAWRHEDADTTRLRPLVISKFAVSAAYLASDTQGAPASHSWNPDTDWNNGVFRYALQQWWDVEQGLLSRGIGPRLRGLWWIQGEEDALATNFSDHYQNNLEVLWTRLKDATGYTSGLKAVIGRIRDLSATADPAALAAVRQAQANFVAGNSEEGVLIDTDAMSLGSDNLHYDALGMIALGEALYDTMALT